MAAMTQSQEGAELMGQMVDPESTDVSDGPSGATCWWVLVGCGVWILIIALVATAWLWWPRG